jgi:hypothetical protein
MVELRGNWKGEVKMSFDYKRVFIKIISAVFSAIVFTLFVSWNIYTPVSERLSNVGYHSFIELFAFNFVPNFFVFIIFGAILSPVIESVIFKKINLKGNKGLLKIVLTYILLGAICGIIVSALFFKFDFIINYIFISILGAIIFLFFQTVFQTIFK